jgi:Holliday junction resolvase YEN1
LDTDLFCRPSVQHSSLVYSADSIENTDCVRLDQAGLLLCILLLGGDYDTGVPGMGPTVAHVLARLGFGRDLVIIMTSRPGQELDDKLAAWRNALREELRTNSRGGLGKRCPKLAEKIVDTFPRLEVVHLYMNPLTSTSPQFVGPVPNSNAWTPQEPNIPSNPS